MICYRCGCRLSEKDFCTGCGADVGLYKRIMFMSNRFYNDGLERAAVRDLSGAMNSLRQSLKFNKNNIDARNLLGLIYFETGEVVEALGQWVISKNLRPNKNIADDYINLLQTSQARLDGFNQALKKYNQSLVYCYQDSKDLAVIQLKKILSVNPKYLRAHQLLSLLYIDAEEWEKAHKELLKCVQIDANNTMTLRYMREVNRMLAPEEGEKNIQKKVTSNGVVRYQSGNETIIQPVKMKENKGVSSLLNLGIGVVIGVAIAACLILPARIQSVKADINAELRTVSEQSDAKTATIDELEQQVTKLTEDNKKLQQELGTYEGTDGTLRASDALMMAADAYLKDNTDIEGIATYMEALETEEQSEDFGKYKTDSFDNLYEDLMTVAGPQLATFYYNRGYDNYRAEDYETAIPDLERAYRYDNTNGEALFYLGNSYRRNNQEDKAKEIYAQVIDNFPGTERASRAETYLAEINNAE